MQAQCQVFLPWADSRLSLFVGDLHKDVLVQNCLEEILFPKIFKSVVIPTTKAIHKIIRVSLGTRERSRRVRVLFVVWSQCKGKTFSSLVETLVCRCTHVIKEASLRIRPALSNTCTCLLVFKVVKRISARSLFFNLSRRLQQMIYTHKKQPRMHDDRLYGEVIKWSQEYRTTSNACRDALRW